MRLKIGIIGAGASGLMAAVTAADYADVTLIEHKEKIGKKILSTGNGRCNFTNVYLSKDDYFVNHPSFVENALKLFDEKSLLSFLDQNGLIVTNKRDGYFYPFSGQAASVLVLFEMLLRKKNVNVLTSAMVHSVIKDKNGKFIVKTDKHSYTFDKLILSCGGKALPVSGSDGSGFELAQKLGIKYHKLLPVLTYIKCEDKDLQYLKGVRTDAKLTLASGDLVIQTEKGELQLNKDNISGIPVFQMSHNAQLLFTKHKKVQIYVDLLPEMSVAETSQKLSQLKNVYIKESLCDVLHLWLNRKLSLAIMHRANIPEDTKISDLSKNQIHKVVELIHNFGFTMNGTGTFDKAQATMGGIDLSELNDGFETNIIPGLYITGEMLDVDGRCGGYNLQWAFTSGYIAGYHSANGENKCYESTNVKLISDMKSRN